MSRDEHYFSNPNGKEAADHDDGFYYRTARRHLPPPRPRQHRRRLSLRVERRSKHEGDGVTRPEKRQKAEGGCMKPSTHPRKPLNPTRVAASRGRFITLEGSEGAGKSTIVAVAKRCLQSMGIDVVASREPGGTPLAEEIRKMLLSTRQETVDPLAETLLMFAARAQHVAEVVKPNIAQGRWVLCERFTDATHAYQGGGARRKGRLPLTRLQRLSTPTSNLTSLYILICQWARR